jgi:hypothetical protein
MLSSESAVETLLRNSPSGLFESIFPEDKFSTWDRYFLALAVSPDLTADIRLVSALSKELPLLFVELAVDDVDDVVSSERRELVLCKLEIFMKRNPFRIDFSKIQLPQSSDSPSYMQGLQFSAT